MQRHISQARPNSMKFNCFALLSVASNELALLTINWQVDSILSKKS